MSIDARAAEVLAYWFGGPDHPEWGRMRPMWFGGGPVVDAECRTRFGELHARAVAGELDGWREDRDACLALVVLLDQFSRNLHRGTPAAFASDAKAREIADHMLAHGWDRELPPIQRWFVYLPFEHAESLADQRRSVALFEGLPDGPDREVGVSYARQHLEIIARFGRFPHRNEILGRPATDDEARWLAEGGTRFG